MTRVLLGLVLSATLFGTGPARAESPPASDDFGAALTLEQATPLAAVLADPERYAGEPVLVAGRLTDVCQRKGCWTELQDGSARVRVRFKDYGFFLPKDSTGRQALAQGVVTIETLSQDGARHYESESRDGDPDSIVGPQRQVGFLASGVRLLRN